MHVRRRSIRTHLTARHQADAIVLSGFGRPFGLGQDLRGNLLVTDMDLHGIFRFSSDLTRFTLMGTKEQDGDYAVTKGESRPAKRCAPGSLNGPHAVDVSPDGRLFVTTYYEPGIQVSNASGTRFAELGIKDMPMTLRGPATAFFDNSVRLLVAEYGLNAILAFTPNGTYLGGLGWSGEQAIRFGRTQSFGASSKHGGFDRPHMCRQGPGKFLIVADTWNHRLQRFNPDGSWAGWLGAFMPEASEGTWMDRNGMASASAIPGGLNAPVAISWAAEGHMVVTEWGNSRLQIFDSNGSKPVVLDGLGLNRPYDAQFLGDRLYVADTHNGRVLVLEASHLPLG